MKLLKTKTGYSVRYKTEFGYRNSRLSAKTEKEAIQEIKDANVQQLEALANANALTMDMAAKYLSGKNLSVGSALKEWNEWRDSEGKSRNTISSQTDFINLFCKFCYGMDKPVMGITHKLVSKWVNNPKSKVGVSTRSAWLSAISAFLSFCSTRQYIPKNPASIVNVNMSKLSHEQKEKKRVQPFTHAEYKVVMTNLDGCFNDNEVNDFWSTACSFSYWLGLRLGDIINLEWKSITQKSIIVWTEKRDARVELPIMHKLTGGGELMKIIAGLDYDGGKYVFDKKFRDKINDPKKRHYFSQQFSTMMQRMNIQNRSFHSFRHSFATRHKNLPLEDVAKLLGHQSVKTTRRYTH